MDVRLLVEAILKFKICEGNDDGVLINSVKDLLEYGKGQGPFSGYKVDKVKLNKYTEVIVPPHWDDKGKVLTFYAIIGWMHEVDTLTRVTATFDDVNAKILINSEILEKPIFSEMPGIMY